MRRESGARDRVVEPGARELPVALDSRDRQAQRPGNLLRREASEELQLDDAALARIGSGQPAQRVMQLQQVEFADAKVRAGKRQGDVFRATTALAGDTVACTAEQGRETRRVITL